MRLHSIFPTSSFLFLLSFHRCALALDVLGLTIGGNQAAATATASASGAAPTAGIIDFLRYLEIGHVSSQDCWITLANATTSPLGTCLQLDSLAQILIAPPGGSYADSVNRYLVSTCGQKQCAAADLAYWRGQIQSVCGNDQDKDTALVRTLLTILDNYSNSYYQLGCGVAYNGSSTNCAAEIIATNALTNTIGFVMDWLSGNAFGANASAYTSLFESPPCTGCAYEMYKATNFLTPNLYQNGYMQQLGGNLQKCAAGAKSSPNWADVADQQKPDIFTITSQQPAGVASGAGKSFETFTSAATIAVVAGLAMLVSV